MAIRILENADGSRYAVGSYHDGVFRVKAHDLGAGHIEVSGVERTCWQELGWTAGQIQDYLDMLADPDHQSDVDKRARALEVAANRAKTRVRKLCKAMGADTLMTLTYKGNQQDLALCKAHLKEFVRRVRRVIPDFRAVCGFEQQKRGAWHVHMATVRLPASLKARNGVLVKSWNVLRAIWRSVTKAHGGNVDISARKRHSQRTAARIAAYLSKYITKAFEEGDKWSNRWTKFGDVEVPPPSTSVSSTRLMRPFGRLRWSSWVVV
ncbi:hypothetical protein [Acidovorax sp. SDU_ACID1]|uniref:rolling circle replication-associated protein n=1 Tax=Acidovorax sp. SDU_ACID1 TaxID=3136632 RepID=UPI003873AFF4